MFIVYTQKDNTTNEMLNIRRSDRIRTFINKCQNIKK